MASYKDDQADNIAIQNAYKNMRNEAFKPKPTKPDEPALATKAYKLGVLAYKKNPRMAPSQDTELMKLIGSLDDKSMGTSIPYIDAWIKGKDSEWLNSDEFKDSSKAIREKD